ncbi:MAG: LamG domain-containing protein, partial [Planctomycetes bacterium]|nr:LamG domain-containing protein [Planctomycetota bacterium]
MSFHRFAVVPLILALVLAPAAQAALIGYWTFDNTPNDSSGSNNNATLQGGALYNAAVPPLVAGSTASLSLNVAAGSNSQHATIPDSASMRPSRYTVSSWIRPDVNAYYGWTGVFGKPGRNYNMWMGNSNSASGFIHHRWWDAAGTNSGAADASPVPIDASTWTHVLIMNDGTVGRTYLNGILAGSGNVSGSLNVSQNTTYVGRNLDGGGDAYFRGLIDDVAMWNGVISPIDVRRLAQGTVSPMGVADAQSVSYRITVGSPSTITAFNAYVNDNLNSVGTQFATGTSGGTGLTLTGTVPLRVNETDYIQFMAQYSGTGGSTTPYVAATFTAPPGYIFENP